MSITIHSELKTKILEAHGEASKDLKASAEWLSGLEKHFERRDDGGIYFFDRIWIQQSLNMDLKKACKLIYLRRENKKEEVKKEDGNWRGISGHKVCTSLLCWKFWVSDILRLATWENFGLLLEFESSRMGRLAWVEVGGVPFKTLGQSDVCRIASKWGCSNGRLLKMSLNNHSKMCVYLLKFGKNIRRVLREKITYTDESYFDGKPEAQEENNIFEESEEEKVQETEFGVPSGEKIQLIYPPASLGSRSVRSNAMGDIAEKENDGKFICGHFKFYGGSGEGRTNNGETKMGTMDLNTVRSCWGNSIFEYVQSDSVGYSGGILLVVYAPQDAKEKHMLWEYLTHISNSWDGKIVMMGDFNERLFRIFIAYSFTRKHRFDYGPILFDFYKYWLEVDGFDKMVRESWEAAPGNKDNAIRSFMGYGFSDVRSGIGNFGRISLIDSSGSQKKSSFGNFSKSQDQWAIEVMRNVNYSTVKDEFLMHFRSRFDKPLLNRALLDLNFTNSLTNEQKEDLEQDITKEEGPSERCWDCGVLINAPGPDGFSLLLLSSFLDLSYDRLGGRILITRESNEGIFNSTSPSFECFFRASGLRINMSKSKIMGVNVEDAKVKIAANKLGCLVLKTPFTYLDSLWDQQVIKACIWEEGSLDNVGASAWSDCWTTMSGVKVTTSTRNKYSRFYQIKAGNGEDSRFGLIKWYEGGSVKESGIENTRFDSMAEIMKTISLVPRVDRYIWSLENDALFRCFDSQEVDEKPVPGGEFLSTRWGQKSVPIRNDKSCVLSMHWLEGYEKDFLHVECWSIWRLIHMRSGVSCCVYRD
ncbi:hypothetical protein Tco_1007793 [Tanacetum coccineum]